ncbi:MAG TPA: hypothetical protein VLW55_09805 [Burkholderiaceae bacterium]|nr:hypothetical protein [Burkholderiaceae bacterium]
MARCLSGVQTNQFPRAVDICTRFRAADIETCIRGFHVSGSIAMLPGATKELQLQQAMDAGISLFAGEAEGRFDQVLRDAMKRAMPPLYNDVADAPALEGVPQPFLPTESVKRTGGGKATFDAGRGCPFLCSFCTIINVHGRTSRFRSPDDVERIVRRSVAQGAMTSMIARSCSAEFRALLAFELGAQFAQALVVLAHLGHAHRKARHHHRCKDELPRILLPFQRRAPRHFGPGDFGGELLALERRGIGPGRRARTAGKEERKYKRRNRIRYAQAGKEGPHDGSKTMEPHRRNASIPDRYGARSPNYK